MRTHQLLYEDETCNVYRIVWPQNHGLGFHHHGEACATITVISGVLTNYSLVEVPNGDFSRMTDELFVEGETFTVLPFEEHCVINHWHEPAVSIHVYSPPLREVYDEELEIADSLLK